MKKIMVFGTFDILHPGHIYFLQNARKYGDFLIVSLARRENVKRIKGRDPMHSEQERKRLLESLKIVDKVIIGSRGDYLKPIVRVAPDVIVLGYDQRYYTQDLQKKLAARGLKVKIMRLKSHQPEKYKSSKLLRRLLR